MTFYWNPFKCYVLSCLAVLGVYSLGFSDLYPAPSLNVLVFLLATSIASALLSWDVSRIKASASVQPWGDARHDLFIAIAIAVAFLVEIAYAGVVPLFAVSGLADYDYRDFGIPTFHVVLVGVCFFYSVYWWDLYLQGLGKLYGWIAFSGVIWALLIMNRGAMLISLVAFLFSYGNRLGLRKRMWQILAGTVLIAWGFGYVGEIRTQAMGIDGEDLILSIGGANGRFAESGIPKKFFWFYLYASSPLANLENTASEISGASHAYVGIVVDFLPDFISKRIVTEQEVEMVQPYLITPQLTVATAYGRPLVTLGWLGPYLLHFYFLLICSGLIRYVRRSRYAGAIVAILCAQGCLMFFDNMVVFSGAVGQVIVGLCLVFGEYHGIRIFRRSEKRTFVVES
jgi:hypothetical protein